MRQNETEKTTSLAARQLAVVPRMHDLPNRREDTLESDRATPDPLDFAASLIGSVFCLTRVSKALGC